MEVRLIISYFQEWSVAYFRVESWWFHHHPLAAARRPRVSEPVWTPRCRTAQRPSRTCGVTLWLWGTLILLTELQPGAPWWVISLFLIKQNKKTPPPLPSVDLSLVLKLSFILRLQRFSSFCTLVLWNAFFPFLWFNWFCICKKKEKKNKRCFKKCASAFVLTS